MVSQIVSANASLSHTTKTLLKTKTLLGIGQLASGDIQRLAPLKEIIKSPALIEEARKIVEEEHGVEKLTYLNQLLRYQQVADSLGVELKLDEALIIQLAVNSQSVTENLYKEVRRAVRDSTIDRYRYREK